ncbi:MAG TPA: hypothetical protein V6C58_05730 [Allocoleopsis sp.]
MSKIVSDLFWDRDVSILFRSDRLLEFFPTKDQTRVEKLNAITRFGIYISVILSIYKRDFRYLFLIVVTLVVTLALKTFSNDTENFEEIEEQNNYTIPTLNNPFGNPSVFDILDNPTKPPMIEYYQKTEKAKKIREDIENKFNFNVFRDVGDIYNRMHGQRELYTIPGSTIPPDSDGKFRKWVFGGLKSCKTDQYNCLRYSDLRRRKPIETILEEAENE